MRWLSSTLPVFPIRDGAKFPSFTHAASYGRLEFTHNQEAIHFLMLLFGYRATPTRTASQSRQATVVRVSERRSSTLTTKIG
ncbi:hypothetical protein VTK26DRAFT_2479 [Humicola hyalothermophila]